MSERNGPEHFAVRNSGLNTRDSVGLLWPWKILATFCFVVPLLLAGPMASGMIFSVTDTNDTVKGSSLRAAIILANRLGGNNTIVLGRPWSRHAGSPQPWVFHLTLQGADEDAAQSGDLDIMRGNLTIQGAGPDVVIDASALGDRVFQVFPRAHLTLQNLAVTGGHAPGNRYVYLESGEAGGAIYNSGSLILYNCLVVGNVSGDGNYREGNGGGQDAGDAGGIYNSGTLALNNCVIAGNQTGIGVDGSSGGNGGGIKNDGNCQLINCVFYNNASGDGGVAGVSGFAGNGGNGGAVYNAGTMTMTDCSVSNNISGAGANGGDPGIVSVTAVPGAPGGAGGSGAGIFNSGQLNLVFCTINGNTNGSGGAGGLSVGFKDGQGGAGGNGAGINNGGSVYLNTCTVGENVCGHGGDGGVGSPYGGDGGVGGSGGGILNAGFMNLLSCTVVGNICGNGGNGGAGIDALPPGQRVIGGFGGAGGWGGGVENNYTNALVRVRNSLIALDLAGTNGLGSNYAVVPPITPPLPPSPTIIPPVPASTITIIVETVGDDVAGAFVSQGFNLIGDMEGSLGLTNGVQSDHVGSFLSPINLFIGPLQMNGGPTPTYALLPGSPAIDQGNCFGVRIDQRGMRRPYNFPLTTNAPGGDGSDIGAYELHP